jgi:hypothetical protein
VGGETASAVERFKGKNQSNECWMEKRRTKCVKNWGQWALRRDGGKKQIATTQSEGVVA